MHPPTPLRILAALNVRSTARLRVMNPRRVPSHCSPLTDADGLCTSLTPLAVWFPSWRPPGSRGGALWPLLALHHPMGYMAGVLAMEYLPHGLDDECRHTLRRFADSHLSQPVVVLNLVMVVSAARDCPSESVLLIPNTGGSFCGVIFCSRKAPVTCLDSLENSKMTKVSPSLVIPDSFCLLRVSG